MFGKVRLLHLNDELKQFIYPPAEAISGLREWAIDYPGLLVSNLGTIVNGIVKLFVDDVRRSFDGLVKGEEKSNMRIGSRCSESVVAIFARAYCKLKKGKCDIYLQCSR